MRCVIAGGGTGGHLFPGIAIAEAFIEKGKSNEVLFVGTKKGIEMRVLGVRGFSFKTIKIKALKGKSIIEKLATLWSLPIAISKAVSILKDFEPDIVIGVGGYASGPVILAASYLGIKTVIHEQNVIPGLTNRMLKYFTHKIFISFKEANRYFPTQKTILTGVPIRKEIVALLTATEGINEDRKDKFQIFIFGGSAGAHRLNEKMIEAITYLGDIKSFLRVIHQTGFNDFNWVSKNYHGKGFDATVKPFFDDMAQYYKNSDLIICRSGASTIGELALAGKAAILIPYPYAAHNHQFFNAKHLVMKNAAMMIEDRELNGKLLAEKILYMFNHPEERERIGKAIRSFSKPDAAQEIVRHCYELFGR